MVAAVRNFTVHAQVEVTHGYLIPVKAQSESSGPDAQGHFHRHGREMNNEPIY
jgi:hypothetical protein